MRRASGWASCAKQGIYHTMLGAQKPVCITFYSIPSISLAPTPLGFLCLLCLPTPTGILSAPLWQTSLPSLPPFAPFSYLSPLVLGNSVGKYLESRRDLLVRADLCIWCSTSRHSLPAAGIAPPCSGAQSLSFNRTCSPCIWRDPPSHPKPNAPRHPPPLRSKPRAF